MSRLEYTILYLLSKAKEKDISNLSKFQIIKLIYLLEVEAYKFTGRSFFDSVYFKRGENGPISVDIYTALENLMGKYIEGKIVKKPDYPYPRHCISLKKNIKKFELKDTEKIFLNSVFGSYLDSSQKKLKAVAYSTEPMKEIIKKEKKMHRVLKGRHLNLNLVPLDEEMIDLFKYE